MNEYSVLQQNVEPWLRKITANIQAHPSNQHYTNKSLFPVFAAGSKSKIVIVGQAPGIKAQTTHVPWNDPSGDRLRDWLGVSKDIFYDTDIFSLMPMDFYYPGKAAQGDLPPRKDFASMWHAQLLQHMPNVETVILAGSYAINYYLKYSKRKNLTHTVKYFHEYLPDYFPLVHPSPLTTYWRSQNEWFGNDVLPVLKQHVASIIDKCK